MLFKSATSSAKLRAGTITLNSAEISTPTFIVGTTRGAVNHLTPDVCPALPLSALFAEDFFETVGPHANLPTREQLPLNTQLLVAIHSNQSPSSAKLTKPNTDLKVGLKTFQGINIAKVSDVTSTMLHMSPDIMVTPYDAPIAMPEVLGTNKHRKLRTRTLNWMHQIAEARDLHGSQAPLIASLTPELCNESYINEALQLCDGFFCLPSDLAKGPALTTPETTKLRIWGQPLTPHGVLERLIMGYDVCILELESYTEKGLALDFKLDCSTQKMSLNLHDKCFEADTSELGASTFSMAYLHHLLNANEMTAQVALQQHNINIFSQFFEDIRASIAAGTFETQAAKFMEHYASL